MKRKALSQTLRNPAHQALMFLDKMLAARWERQALAKARRK
jgi:hypothetical protein